MTPSLDVPTRGQDHPEYQRHWPSRPREVLAALPQGTIGAGRRSIQRGLAAAAALDTNASWTTDAFVAERLIEPLLLVADWPLPSQPLPVGGGAVHADLTDDDHELFAGLRLAMTGGATTAGATTHPGPALDAEALAAAAQELRLPVTPYRQLADASPIPANPEEEVDTVANPETHHRTSSGWARSEPIVVDLTALWAGPLATSLLAELGAKVVKIDPSCRPDALGEHGPLYRALNGAKTIFDLDLRQQADREQFESLLSTADLLIDSFSRRVMPNLGYGPDDVEARFPRLSTLSIVAFPAGTPEQDWVSYGPGVHASSGLAFGDRPAGQRAGQDQDQDLLQPGPWPAPIAYPDVLAGLAAFAAGSRALSARAGTSRAHREVSLAGVLQPLVAASRAP